MTVFRQPGEKDLKAKCAAIAGAPFAVWKWLRSMIEREIHHRGRMYIRLETIRVATPLMYGLNWEDARGVLQPVVL